MRTVGLTFKDIKPKQEKKEQVPKKEEPKQEKKG